MKPTFEEAYRSRHTCDEQHFRRSLFWNCMYGHARILAYIVGGYEGRYFAPERDLISGVGQAKSVRQVRDEIRSYFMDPATWGTARRTLRIRISTTRLLAIAGETMGESPGEEVEGGGSAPPQPKFRGVRRPT